MGVGQVMGNSPLKLIIYRRIQWLAVPKENQTDIITRAHERMPLNTNYFTLLYLSLSLVSLCSCVIRIRVD